MHSVLPSPPSLTPGAPVRRRWARARAGRGSWWWVPLVLSVLFTVSVAIWLELSDRADLESRQRQLITDSLSLEAQITERVGEEQVQLNELAHSFDVSQSPDALAKQEAGADRLSRLGLSHRWAVAAAAG